MREPLDTDKHLPTVLAREAAVELLANLVPPHVADMIWDDIVAPLYDARALAIDWRSGTCKSCSITHPARWAQTLPGRDRKPWPGHQMRCRKYVGPLEHRPTGGHQGSFGWRAACSCGQSWLEYDDEGNRRGCPDAAVSWRGPRPEGELLGREEAQR